MLESKCSHLPFKLFGKMIPVLGSTVLSSAQNLDRGADGETSRPQEDALVADPPPDEVQEVIMFEESNVKPTDQTVEGTPEANECSPMAKRSNCNKTMPKKPNKLLPCPRCDSGDTKFCYYNNYNVNQPRHFCKNCQRYWTAGGTLRNVPVGAGRRKSKHSTLAHGNDIDSDCPQPITSSFSIPSPMASSVISFGLEHCNDAVQALFKCPVTPSAVERNSHLVCGSPHKIGTTPSDARDIAEMETHETKSEKIPLNRDGSWWINACSPWSSYPCNGGWNVSSVNASSWDPSSSASLGKHPRCSQLQSEWSVSVPRTLRINDGKEVCESSIWKNVRVETKREAFTSSSVFKAFKTSRTVESTDNKHIWASPSNVHCVNANPAAHPRSMSYQESA